jgi:hypothetical protein
MERQHENDLHSGNKKFHKHLKTTKKNVKIFLQHEISDENSRKLLHRTTNTLPNDSLQKVITTS